MGGYGIRGRLPQFGECPLPNPPPRGRGQVLADSSVAGRLKKNARNINSSNFSGSLLSQGRWNKRRERFFQTTFEPIGRVCAARHARGWLGLQGKWRTRACVPHTPYMRATACSPTGEGAGCSRFCGFRRFEKQLGFATVNFRPSEKEKSSLHNLFSLQNP